MRNDMPANRSSAEGTLRVYSASGSEVFSGSLTTGSNKISIEQFDAGVYMNRAEMSDGSSYTGKLIRK